MQPRLIARACTVVFTLANLFVGAQASATESFVMRYVLAQAIGNTSASTHELVRTVVDVWMGGSEVALISAGYKVESMNSNGQSLGSLTLEQMITSDVKVFELDGLDVRIKMRRPGGQVEGLDLNFSAASGKLELNEHQVRILEAYFTIIKLDEADYVPMSLAGNLKVFESHNPTGVPFARFFAARNVTFPRVVKGELQYSSAFDGSRSGGGTPGSRKIALASEVISTTAAATLTGFKALDEELEILLTRPKKPRIADLVKALRSARVNDPTIDPLALPETAFIKRSLSIREAMSRMPEVRNQLERAFPGATWYILGRDAFLFGDALEALYLSEGITGRVVRLPASAPSFDGASNELVDGFLKTFGIDVDHIETSTTPKVILDISSYSLNSQSRQLLRAGYARWLDLRREPKVLVRKYNFLNIFGGHVKQKVGSAYKNDLFLDQLTFSPEPSAILGLDGPQRFLYVDGWHQVFKRFQTLPGGGVIAPAGQGSPRGTRLYMIEELWNVISFYGEKLWDLPAGDCATNLKNRGQGET